MREWLDSGEIDLDLIDEIRLLGIPSLHEATAMEIHFLTVDGADTAAVDVARIGWRAVRHLLTDLPAFACGTYERRAAETIGNIAERADPSKCRGLAIVGWIMFFVWGIAETRISSGVLANSFNARFRLGVTSSLTPSIH